MEQHINDIQTPVHASIELEFSFYRLLLRDASSKIIYKEQKEGLPSNAFFKQLEILSLDAYIWPQAMSIIPEDLKDLKDKDLFLSSLNMDSQKHLIKHSSLPEWNLHSIYSILPNQQLSCLTWYPGSKIYNPVNRLIETGMRHLASNVICVHLEQKKIWIVLKKEGQLSLCNVFDCQSKEEALYFISACSHAHFKEFPDILIGGGVHQAHLDLIKTYVPRLNYIQASETMENPQEFYQLLR